ncbi:hypothetical protein G6O69_14895 [Pseudenhygromyxa sp. WMMC2535]|uniref:hypothetical protein n=1 Tax=Pseudenhygromyxa sp. WMMC2535 TaxID=2712867 RepID=UPI0015583149|nr:hypothetical protein [Pseudenhygromyxa sp. WMMC2535]NVB39129.1 hypothetical protein [Pseudenhygromyxa sp. WMMC2535]
MPSRPSRWLLCASAALSLCFVACKRDKDSTDPEEGTTAGGETQAGPSASAAYGSGPSVSDVCMHLYQIVAADAGQPDAPVDPQMMDECQRELSAEQQMRGPENWAAVGNCVLQASSELEIDACDRAHPMPGQQGGGPGMAIDPNSVESQVCVHMLEIVITETAEIQGAMPELSEDELRSLHEECVLSLLEGEKPNRSPESYQGLLECIAAGTNSAALQSCE